MYTSSYRNWVKNNCNYAGTEVKNGIVVEIYYDSNGKKHLLSYPAPKAALNLNSSKDKTPLTNEEKERLKRRAECKKRLKELMEADRDRER
jgi:hypothetical protein